MAQSPDSCSNGRMNNGDFSLVINSETDSVSNKHHLLTLPSPPPRRRRSRQGSGTSQMSVGSDRYYGDNVSCASGSSLAYFYQISRETGDDSLPCLVLARTEKVPLKDFSSEVRASLDIEKFLKDAVLLLDIDGRTLEDIIESMLRNIFANDQFDNTKLEHIITDAKRNLFMQATCLDHKYQRLSKTIKSISLTEEMGLGTDQSWVCTMCSLSFLKERRVSIARLRNPVNLGRSSESVYFIILILTPIKEKGSKSEIELGRTFSTLLADTEFRQQLLYAESEADFKNMLQEHAKELAVEQRLFRRRSLKVKDVMNQAFTYDNTWFVANGIRSDLKKRLPFYPSDFYDGLRGKKQVQKMLSATCFLYFACLLPTIGFGVLNENNTGGKFNVQRVILSQGISGLVFAFFGGQPLIVMLTTAPLTLYTKVIYTICIQYNLNFYAMYGWVGVFNAIFLFLYAIFDLSKLMRWSTRSTEEIFAFFISIAFVVDACKDVMKDFRKHYFSCFSSIDAVSNFTTTTEFISSDQVTSNVSDFVTIYSSNVAATCSRETSILFLLLTIGTVWLALYMLNFTKTPFLNKAKRELMSDFALPVSVLLMSFVGSFIFHDIKLASFNTPTHREINVVLNQALPWQAIASAFGIAFPLSLLFFMEQNISSAMVNCPSNKLRKGSAYHWDLMIVSLINLGLSIFGMPWVHGALPHSPMHVKALADLEDRIDVGQHLHQSVVRVRETRLTGIISSILILLSILLPLQYIPVAVLDGLFIYMAITALYENQIFERILLLVTEQTAYPPSHYLRRVPQRKVHIFTILQLLQLIMLCVLGFAPTPYTKLGFPIVLMLQLPIRHILFPRIISETYLDALDKPI